MILVSNTCAVESKDNISLFILTNLGPLYFYAHNLTSANAKWPLAGGVPSQLSFNEDNGRIVRIWEATFTALNLTSANAKWPLAGGVPSQLLFNEYNGRIVRIWEAIFPVMYLMFVVQPEVRLYRLLLYSEGLSLRFVTETKHEDSVTGSSSSVISVETVPVICTNDQKFSENETLKEPPKEIAFILTLDAHVTVIDSITGNIIHFQSLSPKKVLSTISFYILLKFFLFLFCECNPFLYLICYYNSFEHFLWAEGKISATEDSGKHSLFSSQDSRARSKSTQTNSCSQSGQPEVGHAIAQTKYLGQISETLLLD